ncbi:SMI1 / KNR4 family (SUKH-1) [Clostridium cavendishii DSM 21758]|uniref:SMI1 / KNR4 family (SUKH-1) n=1 Tax=Clostridium cavendishii DSM 21758 TaxID=1121302 RepID=A0A1M6GN33_9CLOT|nr:SMI1/KNR4 family protein [Clostridium cavendishii]SHJ11310.1 SMI1 / KNR4 family (SUKH-1) [Clostridium cavendishii DSM 21758]
MNFEKFNYVYGKGEGATFIMIETLKKTWNKELSEEEKEGLNKWINPENWSFPQRVLPEAYLEFLKYDNGAIFGNGDRYFQFFTCQDDGNVGLREMNISYEFPEYMKGGVSFAMDGCGNHYIFDMRKEAVNGEYPILTCSSGCLSFEDSKLVGQTFFEVLNGKTSMDSILFD